MTMDTQRPNDIFAAIIQKPDATVFDLAASNATPDNTQLLSAEDYKQSAVVQKAFQTPDGKFDDAAFNKAYEKAADLYHQFDTDKTLANALQYDPLDFTAPRGSKKETVNPTVTPDFNPFKEIYGLTGINSVDDSPWSYRQIAQQSNIWDTVNKKWLNKSAADLGFFGSLFGDTLVYAQWDDDGTNIDPISGHVVTHKKGEWKYNSNGDLYVETLGGRDLINKQVVNPTDLITKKGTWLNKIDFLDSDGKDKSFIGSTMKLAVEIAPFFIPEMAGVKVSEWYAGFKLAMGMADIIPTVYKVGEGLFTGDSNGTETDMYKAMTKASGFLAKFNTTSLSDAAQQSTFNWEQLGNSVADIFTLIHEQRAAAKLASLFYKSQATEYMDHLQNIANEAALDSLSTEKDIDAIKSPEFQNAIAGKMQELSTKGLKQSVLAKNLGLGFMALSQATPMYNDAINNGYDRRTAAFASLLAVTGQYVVMDNHIGTWILDKTVGYSANDIGLKVRQATMDALDNSGVKDIFDTLNKNALDSTTAQEETKKAFGKAFKTFKDKIGSFFTKPMEESSPKNLAANMFKAGILQGVEMTALTGIDDVTKGIVDLFSSLGLTSKRGSFGGFNNVFSEEGYKRYLSTFVGGLVGGPIFEIERTILTPALNKEIKPDKKTEYGVLQGIADGHEQDMYDLLDSMVPSLGNNEMSPLVTDVNGKKLYLTKDAISQSEALVAVTKQYIKQIANIMHADNLAKTDKEILQDAVKNQLNIKDLEASGVHRFILSDFKQKASDIVALRTKIQQLQSEDEVKNKIPDSPKTIELNKAYAELEEKREWVTKFKNGDYEDYYHGLALFSLSPLHEAFISLTPQEYSESVYNEDFNTLTPAVQKIREAEFNSAFEDGTGDYKNKMKAMYDVFLTLTEKVSPSMAKYDESGTSAVRSSFYNHIGQISDQLNLFSPNYIGKTEGGIEAFNSMNKELIKRGLAPLKLDTLPELSLGRFLIDRNLVELTPSIEEKKSVLRNQQLELAKYFGYTKEENETEDQFLTRTFKDVNTLTNTALAQSNAIDRLKQLIPDFKNKHVSEVVSEILEKPDLDSSSTIELLNLYSNYMEAIENKAKVDSLPADNDPNIDQETWESVGLVGPLTREKADAWHQHINDTVEKLGNELADLSNKEGTQFNQKAVEIYKKYEKLLNKGTAIPNDDAIKESIIAQIDQIPLVNGSVNLPFLKEEIENIQKSRINKIEQERRKAYTNITDPEQLQAQLELLEEEEKHWVNFKLKDDIGSKFDIISPKLELVLKYAEDTMAREENLDDQTVQYLEGEKEKLESILYDTPTLSLPDEERDQVNEYLDNVEKKINEINKILEYPKRQVNVLLEALQDLDIQMFGNQYSINPFKVYQENIAAFNSVTDGTQFKREDLQIAQLRRALGVIKVSKAIVAAMSSREIGVSNRHGFNVSLNAALERRGEKAKYATISDGAAINMFKDLNKIENTLTYLKNLAELNASTMIVYNERVQKAVIEGITNQILDKNSPLSFLNLNVGGVPLLNQQDLDAVEKMEPEQKLVELESRAYKTFHSLTKNIKYDLDQLFKPFFEGQDPKQRLIDYKSAPSSELTESFKELQLPDFYNYVHFVLAYDSKDAYQEYKILVKNEVNSQRENKKAPFYIQQRALRETLAYIQNKQIVQHITDYLQEDIEDVATRKVTKDNKTSEQIAEELIKTIQQEIGATYVFPIKNIMGVLGSGGVGKSSVIMNWALRTIINSKKLGETVDIIGIAPNEDTLNILKQNLSNNIEDNTEDNRKHKINYYTSEQFFKKVLKPEGYALLKNAHETIARTKKDQQDNLNKKGGGDKYPLDPQFFIKGSGDGAVLVTKKFLDQYVKMPEDNADPTVLVADEMSKFTTLEWQILNYLGQSGGTYANRKYDKYYILAAGDDLQNGVVLGDTSFGMESILLAHTIKLKVPIRAENAHQNDAVIKLERYVENLRQYSYLNNNPSYVVKEPMPPELNYYDKTMLQGSKFIPTLSIEDLKKLDPTKKIVILSDDQDRDKDNIALIQNYFKDSANKEIPIYPSEVAGREFDQVIVLADIDKGEHKYFTGKNLYTLLSRAHIATLIVGKAPLQIKQNELLYPAELSINQNIINNYLDKRLAELEELTKDYSNIEEQGSINIFQATPGENIAPKDSWVDWGDGVDLPEEILVNTDTSNGTNTSEEPKKSKEYSDDVTFGYSFFNNLGVEGDIIQTKYLNDPTEKYVISDTTDLNGEKNQYTEVTTHKITWSDLINKLTDHITGTDLFSLPYRFSSDTPLQQILSDYVKFKNQLLFSYVHKEVKKPDTYLGAKYDSNEGLYIKELSSYSQPFGKLVNSQLVTGTIRVLGTYITVNDEKSMPVRRFVTLASLPDLKNENTRNGLRGGLEAWKAIYEKVANTELKELPVNEKSLEVYGGIQTPKDKTKKVVKLSTPINYKDIQSKFPGATIGELRVFRGDLDKIGNILTEYDQTKGAISQKRSELWKSLRFHPYFVISYVEGVNQFERVVVLDPKSRPLPKLWEEIKKAQENYDNIERSIHTISSPTTYTVDSDINSENDYNISGGTDDSQNNAIVLAKDEVASGHLLSVYRGWALLRDFLNSQSNNDDNDVKAQLINKINDFFKSTHSNYKAWEPFSKALDAIRHDPNIGQSFTAFVGPKDGTKNQEIRNIYTNAKDTREFRISNPIYLIHRLWEKDKSKEFFAKYWEEYVEKHKDDQYYYNAILTSAQIDEAGASYGLLSEEQQQFYEMKYVVEPNWLKINIPKFLKEDKIETQVESSVGSQSENISTSEDNLNGLKQPEQSGYITHTFKITEKDGGTGNNEMKLIASDDPTKESDPNYIPIRISLSDKEKRNELLNFMHTLAMHNITGISWQIGTYTDPKTGARVSDGKAYGENGDELSLRIMLTNIYNEASYMKDKSGKWNLKKAFSNDYFRMTPDKSEQHTTCESS